MPAPLTLRDELEKAYAAVMSFPEGLTVLRHILGVTGYADILKTYDPQTSELNVNATLYNLSKRDVWIQIKEYLTPKQQCILEEEPLVKIIQTDDIDNQEENDYA